MQRNKREPVQRRHYHGKQSSFQRPVRPSPRRAAAPQRLAHGITATGHAEGRDGACSVDPAMVEDVFVGCATPEGDQPRLLRAMPLSGWLPSSTSGATINRFAPLASRRSPMPRTLSSMKVLLSPSAPVWKAFAGAAFRHQNTHRYAGLSSRRSGGDLMTNRAAEIVADRYNVSQPRTSTRRKPAPYRRLRGKRLDGVRSLPSNEDETGQQGNGRRNVSGHRRRPWRLPTAPARPMRRSQASPVSPAASRSRKAVCHCGQCLQLSDGAAASSSWKRLKPSRASSRSPFRRLQRAGCDPDEMGIGPVFAVYLLERHGLKVDDIDLWELNEAFASQCLYSRDRLGSTLRNTTSMAARSPSATRSA